MPPGRPLQPTLVTDASWRRVAQANGRLDVRNWQIGMIGMIGMDVHVAQSIKRMFSVHVSRCILSSWGRPHRRRLRDGAQSCRVSQHVSERPKVSNTRVPLFIPNDRFRCDSQECEQQHLQLLLEVPNALCSSAFCL